MIPALIGGTAAIAGAWMQNRGAKRAARRAEDFSERMASTQAQRAVADFKAAGLNPALAYGHQAAAPAGVQAPVEDVGGRGASTAMAARQQRAQLRLLDSQQYAAEQQGHQASSQSALNMAQTAWQRAMIMPSLKQIEYQNVAAEIAAREGAARARLINANTDLSLYGINRARRESEFWEGFGGSLAPWISTGADVSRFLSPWLIQQGRRR